MRALFSRAALVLALLHASFLLRCVMHGPRSMAAAADSPPLSA